MNVIQLEPANIKWSQTFAPEIAHIKANKAAVNIDHVTDSLLEALKEIDLGLLISYIPKVMKFFGHSIADNANDRDTAVRILSELVDKADIGEEAERAFIKDCVARIAEKVIAAHTNQFAVNNGSARDQMPNLEGANLDAWATEQANTLAPLFISGEGQPAAVTPGAITAAIQAAMELVERVGTFADNPERKTAAVQIILRAAHAAAGVAGLPEDKIDSIVTPIANAAIEVFIKASKGGYQWLNEGIEEGAHKLDDILEDDFGGKGNKDDSGSGSQSKKCCGCTLI